MKITCIQHDKVSYSLEILSWCLRVILLIMPDGTFGYCGNMMHYTTSEYSCDRLPPFFSVDILNVQVGFTYNSLKSFEGLAVTASL